ncbi:hypothetical protein EDEG_00738 [Edhazardia aedis USNM 41457]|uniref:RING-type domain-containing protein n=1 Tax=Edhazardia aedis (strain USNM 41457) TaxID=1003232 RepID=J9DV55_EDHAE|nr:hypothetical protein EDEG_00738 [Edhazardia aedis USNM 41457]|eukprot:EJW05172.1 hypothetical protein EDEG_00738 [Edhazardia aedis USNM 41457]
MINNHSNIHEKNKDNNIDNSSSDNNSSTSSTSDINNDNFTNNNDSNSESFINSANKKDQKKCTCDKIPNECSVCLEKFLPKDKIRIFKCNHIFHSRCVDKWLTDFTAQCPICRKPVM